MLNEWYGERLNKAIEIFELGIKKAHESVEVLHGVYNMIETVYPIMSSECVTDEFKDHAYAVEHAAKYITRVAVTMANDFDGNQEELVKNFRKEIKEYEEYMRR